MLHILVASLKKVKVPVQVVVHHCESYRTLFFDIDFQSFSCIECPNNASFVLVCLLPLCVYHSTQSELHFQVLKNWGPILVQLGKPQTP